MTPTVHAVNGAASVEEVQKGWHELTLRVAQLEAERAVLEHENKTQRLLLERVIEHRQKSHCELVLLLTGMVSKLQINDVGVLVSRLVEHNKHVSDVLAALVHGNSGDSLPQPQILKALDQVKRDLVAAMQPLFDELIRLDAPLERESLQALITQPESFF